MSIWEWVSNCVCIRGDHFRFGLVFIKKKVIKTSFFYIKQTETGSNWLVSGRLFWENNRFKPTSSVFSGLIRFGSVFPGLGLVWFGFFGFRLIKPNWTGRFFKNSNRFFFMIRLLFFDFLDLIGFFFSPLVWAFAFKKHQVMLFFNVF